MWDFKNFGEAAAQIIVNKGEVKFQIRFLNTSTDKLFTMLRKIYLIMTLNNFYLRRVICIHGGLFIFILGAKDFLPINMKTCFSHQKPPRFVFGLVGFRRLIRTRSYFHQFRSRGTWERTLTEPSSSVNTVSNTLHSLNGRGWCANNDDQPSRKSVRVDGRAPIFKANLIELL